MSEIRVDTISEKTSANGVAIDSLLIKDQKITNHTGMIAQCEQQQYHTFTQIASSSTYTDTGVTDTITPSSTSSKILVICTFNGQQSGSDYAAKFTLYRDSTDLSGGSELGITRANVANIFTSIAMSILDTPSSTSAITYAAYLKNGGSGTSTSCTGNVPGKIIAMEIGA